VVLPGCAEIGSEMRSDFNENSAVPKRITSARSAEALIFEFAAGLIFLPLGRPSLKSSVLAWVDIFSVFSAIS